MHGFFLGSTDELMLGRYRGTTQSLLSAALNPPRKAPYALPVVLWLIGFLPAISVIVNRIPKPLNGILAMAYVLLLPISVLASLFYNLVVRPGKRTAWEEKFICQRCGAIGPGWTADGGTAERRDA